MYDDNVTLTGIKKEIDVARQGEVLYHQNLTSASRKFYIESYGCAMNFSDSEIVASILTEDGFGPTRIMEEYMLYQRKSRRHSQESPQSI